MHLPFRPHTLEKLTGTATKRSMDIRSREAVKVKAHETNAFLIPKKIYQRMAREMRWMGNDKF